MTAFFFCIYGSYLVADIYFNGNKCLFTFISMNSTIVKDTDGKLQKDKGGSFVPARVGK